MMPRKRVLIIVENLPVPFDRRVWQEATALEQAGYAVSVICPKGKGHNSSHEVLEGVNIYRHPELREGNNALGYAVEYASALFWEYVLAWRVFLKQGFDVIHACNPPDLIVLVALLFKPFGTKFIFDHHDINPELFQVKFSRQGWILRALYFFERLTFRNADAVISTNESYKKIAIERGKKDPKQVFVVRSAPDTSRIHPTEVVEKSNSGLVTIGYVGIMGAQDGIDGLLRIADDLINKRRITHLRFLLIGDGTELGKLRALSQSLGLQDYVQFTGYLRGQTLIEALASIDIGAAPDEKNDYNDKCTMNKIMEYMAMGKPIVQYDLTEGRFSAGESSLYAKSADESDFADKILELATNSELRNQLAEAGRKRMNEQLDWRFETPNLLAAYKLVLE